MPLKLDITPRALDQLDDIQAILDESRSGRADAFIDKLAEVGELLILFPEMGRQKESLGPGIRVHYVWDYLLLYRVTEDYLRVEAVIHGARDIEAVFNED